MRAPFVLDSPTWHEGMKVVESLGLVYDIGCGITQLEEVAQVARAFPDISMVRIGSCAPANNCGSGSFSVLGGNFVGAQPLWRHAWSSRI
eukprot:COSAG01_NODE_33_length_35013_cov_86.824144_27_plen_90_part_00